jgi:hypothetical protein
MRLSLLALAVAGGLLCAGAAAAQGVIGMGQSQMGPNGALTPQSGDPFASSHAETPRERQVAALSRLRTKMLRMAAEDGGQLSEAHKAALQRELDAINKTYAASAGPRR